MAHVTCSCIASGPGPDLRWKMIAIALLVVLLLAVVGGASGIFFGLAFRQLGEFHVSLPFVIRWATNPFIVLAFVTGIAARLFYYLALKFLNVSQIALL